MAERPQPRGFDVNQPGSTQETFTGLVQGATTDLVGGVVDLFPYLQFAVSPTVASVMPDAADEVVAEYGSEALGEKVFGTAPTPELQRIRDDARLVGSLAGAGEAITARGAKTVGDGISSFMKFLDRREAITPEGITAALPDTSTTEMIGGLMGKDGPSKFSEARAARRTKSDQEIYDELAAYFDESPLGGERDSFRYVVPGVEDSTLKFNLELDERGREVVSDNKVSSANDYLTVSDHPLYQNIFGLKPDVARARIAQTEGGDTFIDYETMNNLSEGTKDVARFPELSEILDYPELYEQYPQLAKMKVFRLIDAEDQGIQAAYVRDGFQNKPVLLIGDTVDASSLQSSILHEVQHAIQAIENNPGGAAFTDIYNRLDQAFPEVDERIKRKAAMEYYQNAYGEVEARMVQQMFRDPGSKEVVPTELRREMVSDADVNVAESDAVDRFGGIQESRITGFVGGSEPERFFHGTGSSFKDFNPDAKYTFVTNKPRVANFFSVGTFEGAPNIRPVYIKDGNFFDPKNPDHLQNLSKSDWYKANKRKLRKHPLDRTFLRGEGKGSLKDDYEMIESTGLDDALREMGYDGFTTYEMGAKNLAVFNTENIVPGVAKKAEGGVISLVDVARDMTRGPRGVESLVPVARNMNRSMLG